MSGINPQSPILNTNVLPKLNEPYQFYPLLFILTFFAVITCILLFKSSPETKTAEIITSTILYILGPLLLMTIFVYILPNFASIKQFILQMSSVFYVFFYTIGLIVFFSIIDKQILNDYGYIITPVSLFFASVFLFKGFKNDYIANFSINYERIKSLILFVCLISLFFTFYSVDPGGYIKQNFGYSLVLTIVLSVLSFVYAIVLITYPDSSQQPEPTTNLFSKFTKFSTFGSLLLILFIIIFAIGITVYPGGVMKNPFISIIIITFMLTVSIWGILLITNIFPETTDRTKSIKTMNFLQRAMLMLLSLSISGVFIGFIVYNIQTFTGTTSIPSLLLNIIAVTLVLAIVYKTIFVKFPTSQSNSKKNSFFSLIMNIIFYIPCIFIGLFDLLLNIFTGRFDKYQANDHIGTSIAIIASVIVLSLLYIGSKYLYEKINLQGGKLLLNDPVYLTSLRSLTTSQELTGVENPSYQYGLSCWVYIDSAAPNANESYVKYSSIMSYNGKPNIVYKANTHTLLVTVANPESPEKNSNNEYEDEIINGVTNRVLYKNDNFLLQKWNNIILNYNGGTLDVFLNGELVKSCIEVVPIYDFTDTLTIGEKDGLHGGICNIVYFNRPLTRTNIYYLYNMVKNLTPPITTNKYEIIQKNV